MAVAESGLGILRGEPKTPVSRLPADALEFLDSDQLVLVTKAMTRATVHRPAWLDCLTVKRYDAAGKVIGEARFLGLYTSKAYAAAVPDIPQIRRRAADVMAAAGVLPESHAAKSLQTILDDYPRDELFQIDTATLDRTCRGHPAIAGAPAGARLPAPRPLWPLHLGTGVRAARPLQHRAALQNWRRTLPLAERPVD